ncbi:hypothetical protein LWI28_024682 [Acer negundo]|uniref:Uncharacterized protein n=1 Tax=Acer negundo TaxID=4023 RepID=A0AAD5J6I2_ACENE|nr:hypothetical protein LWI28_024682 [Acer negundo]
MEEGRVPMLSSSFTLKSGESIRLASLVSPKSRESFIRLGSEGLLISDFEDPSLESSPITFKVCFSSLVAVCSSYVYGHAYSVFSSILTVGAMLGAVMSGRVADFVGRRAVSFSGFRSFYVSVTDFDSTCQTGHRNFRVVLHFWLAFDYVSRGIIPGAIQLPCLFFIPESPRWLAKVGKMKEFEASLQSIRGENFDISQEATEIEVRVTFVTFRIRISVIYSRPAWVLIDSGAMHISQPLVLAQRKSRPESQPGVGLRRRVSPVVNKAACKEANMNRLEGNK